MRIAAVEIAFRIKSSEEISIQKNVKIDLTDQKMNKSKHVHTLLTGSTTGKYPVVMDNGRTIIYIADKSKENEVRQKYTMHERHPDAR